MEHLNQALFLLIHAGKSTPGIAVVAARVLAQDLVWIVPAGLVAGWLRSSAATRQVLLAAALAGLTGLLVNQLIGAAWYHPRPFASGYGPALIVHAADSSFPSDHLTLIWAVAFSLLLHRQTRLAGWTLILLGVPVAWARVYLGLHFPLDILGAALVALSSTWLIGWQEELLITPLMRAALPTYQKLFSTFIRKGWVRQ